VDGTNFTTFKDGQANANPVDTSNGGVGAAVTPSGDVRYYVPLPDAAADSSGNLSVWVRQGAGANNRTVYDGIAYDNVPVPEPSTLCLAALGLLGLLACGRRRRRR